MKESKLQLAVTYMFNAMVVPKKARKLRQQTYWAVEETNISKIVTENIADLLKYKVGDTDYYSYNDKLWRWLEDIDGGILSAEKLQEVCSEELPRNSLYHPFPYYCYPCEPKSFDLEKRGLREIGNTTQQAEIARVTKIASELLVVNDRVLKVVEEPVYRITTFGCGKNMTAGMFVDSYDKGYYPSFKADQYNLACLYADSMIVKVSRHDIIDEYKNGKKLELRPVLDSEHEKVLLRQKLYYAGIIRDNKTGIIFDDFTFNEDLDCSPWWTQICDKCASRLDKKYLNNDGSGICGVSGCNNESNHYFDADENFEVLK